MRRGPFQPDFGWSGNNHILTSPTGSPTYDAAGEITTGTAGNVYLYDAEGRICAVATAGMDGMGPSMTGYVYDAAGNRVAKGPITKMSCDPTQNGFETSGEESDYISNQQGQPVTKLTMDEGVMTWNYTNVYADGQLFATYDAQGLHFDLDDWLGTRRVFLPTQAALEWGTLHMPAAIERLFIAAAARLHPKAPL